MKVYVANPRGTLFTIEVHTFDKVLTMKQKIEKSQGIPVSKQTLNFRGKVLQDNLDIVECQIHADSAILLTVSPDNNPNPNQNNNDRAVQSPATSNPIEEFVNNPGWPAMGINDQVLETDQFSKPDQSLESVAKFLGVQESVETFLGDQSIFGEELTLTTEQFSNIQNYWPATTQEETNYGQDLSAMVRSNNNESLPPSNTSAETAQVSKTKKRPPVKEIIEIKDSPKKKKIKISPMKLTIMVTPFMETREIPVEVNARDKVKELKKELAKMQQRGELDLPQEGYFFIHRQSVLNEDQSFLHHGVAHGDNFEIFRGSYTIKD